MEESIMGGYFDQEVRRRDDKIRGLGVEIDSLQKQSDLKKIELEEVLARIESSQKVLAGINQEILEKRTAFEVSVSASLSDLSKREDVLKQSQEEHTSDLKKQIDDYTALNSSKAQFDSMKSSLIEELKGLSIEVNQKITDAIQDIHII